MGKLTKPQRARLEKLATYLEGLPEDYSHFQMMTVMSHHGGADIVKYARKNGGLPGCGTVACAIGHGPAAGVFVPPRMINDGSWVSWGDYGQLFVTDIDWSDDWSFGASWAGYDNDHHGAAARIRYLLANGKPPESYRHPSFKWATLYAPYRIDAKAPANA